MSERTPGRWVLSGKQTIRTESGAWIGKTNWSNGAANAEFIVRACNAHDDLVAALEEAIVILERLDTVQHLAPFPQLDTARAAIAKAKP